tara:strand:+ start:436 stop:1500 length:1065 start_codon:yes stop_codon:yes gene_type:complete
MKSEDFFTVSPFNLVPDISYSDLWCGRPAQLKNLKKIEKNMSIKKDSTMDLIWSSFGGGKTHALFYLSSLLSDENKYLPLYFETPPDMQKFMDLYREIVKSLPLKKVCALIDNTKDIEINHSLRQASRTILHGRDTEKNLCIEWLTAKRPHLTELKRFTGITSRIEDEIFATSVLSDIIKIMDRNKIRTVMLLDDYQRASHNMKEKSFNTLGSFLRNLFNRHPRNFSLIIAMVSRMQQTALNLFPQEIRTIMGMRPAVELPEMSIDESKVFILERFQHFRPENFNNNQFFPFNEKIVMDVLEFMKAKGTENSKLIPRRLLQVFGQLFNEVLIEEKLEDENFIMEAMEALNWDEM